MFGFAYAPVSLAVLLQLVAAQQTSLIIPGFDAQPFSADVVGVDSQANRTTWAVHNGPTDATFTPEDQFPGVATLIEGNNYVSIGYIFSDVNDTNSPPETLAVECTLTELSAGSCSGSAFGTPIATSQTTFTPFPVLVGTSAPAVSTSSGAPSPVPTSTIVSSTSTTPTSTATSAAATPSKSNGATAGDVGYISFVGLNLYVVMSIVGNIL